VNGGNGIYVGGTLVSRQRSLDPELYRLAGVLSALPA
jgi:hypothetical protein